jgi:cell division protein ZapA (FtsZ GTPase activity inhibitor)
MNDLSKYTLIELQKMGNDIKSKHDGVRQEIIDLSHDMEVLENMLNDKVQELKKLEENYVEIVEKLVE